MSENKANYQGQGLAITIAAFKNRPCGLGIENPDFVLPTPEEVKSLRKILGLTQIELAQISGVSWNSKDSSTVRKWETTKGKERRKISPSAWQLMLIKAGIVQVTPLNNNYESKIQETS